MAATPQIHPQHKYSGVNLALLQAREAVVSRYRPILHEEDITEQQWRIIRLLAAHGTLDFQDLAEKTCILRPSLTGILSRLEHAGLVMRLKPANDQRRVYLKLSEEGIECYKKLKKLIVRCFDELEQVFPEEKMRQLLALLEELAHTPPPAKTTIGILPDPGRPIWKRRTHKPPARRAVSPTTPPRHPS